MKNILAVFGGVVGIFFLHLLVFFVSDSYKNVFKSMKYDSYSQNQENSACDCESQTPEKEIVYQEVSDPYADIKNQWFTRYRQYMQAIA